VVVTACHDLGKTFTMARIVLWFTSVFKGAKVVTTAPTFRQVRLLLWSEIRNGFHNSKIKLGGDMLTTEWKISDDWFAIGVASRHEAGADTHGSGFQGVHAPHILIVFDEAQGIPQDIWRQSEGMMTSANVKMVAIGNPLSKGSAFYQATKDPFWHHIKLTCFDSQNLPANGFTSKDSLREELSRLQALGEDERNSQIEDYKIVKPHLLTAQWVIRMALKMGLDHPLVQSKALGDFPDSDENVLIPLELVEMSQSREIDPGIGSHFGVDVARLGSDKTVITEVRGDVSLPPVKLIKKTNTEVAGKVVELIRNTETPLSISIDATGVGSGVVDILRENLSQQVFASTIKINEVHFGQSCDDAEEKKKFSNVKAKMFFQLADEMKRGLRINDDSAYQEELPDIRYNIDSKGRIQIESKEDYKARTGKQSPDSSDSLALAVYGKLQYNKRVDVSYDFSGINLTKTSTWRR